MSLKLFERRAAGDFILARCISQTLSNIFPWFCKLYFSVSRNCKLQIIALSGRDYWAIHHIILLFGQILFTIWTNTFFQFWKYILQFWQRKIAPWSRWRRRLLGHPPQMGVPTTSKGQHYCRAMQSHKHCSRLFFNTKILCTTVNGNILVRMCNTLKSDTQSATYSMKQLSICLIRLIVGWSNQQGMYFLFCAKLELWQLSMRWCCYKPALLCFCAVWQPLQAPVSYHLCQAHNVPHTLCALCYPCCVLTLEPFRQRAVC